LAKVENAWRQLPHVVSLGAQKNFLSFSSFATQAWDKNPSEFNEEYFKRVIAKTILFRQTELIVSKQPWYQGGYRANIVAYAVAKLAQMIEVQVPSKALDMRGIWNRQELSHALRSEIAHIARAVVDVITAPEGGLQNVTEWCKKELCWRRVAAIELELSKPVRVELIDRDEELQQKKDAKADQDIESSIAVETLVFTLGTEYWKEMREFGRKELLLSPDDDGILKFAATPGKIPSEKQCKRLMQIKARLEGEGFSPPVVRGAGAV